MFISDRSHWLSGILSDGWIWVRFFVQLHRIFVSSLLFVSILFLILVYNLCSCYL